ATARAEHARDERRRLEVDVDALRPVLPVPAPIGLGLVVARDELADLLVADRAALAVDALVEAGGVAIDEEPLAATPEAQPAVDRRHVGPARHGPQHLLIHRSSPCPSTGRTIRAPGAAARRRRLRAASRRIPHGR